MYCVRVEPPDTLDGFREAARRLLAAGAEPDAVIWSDATLFAAHPPDGGDAPLVPRVFITLAETVACHRDEARWPLLYQALWRLNHGERALLDQPSDPLVHRLQRMATAVRHDAHRMTAFLRFREVGAAGEDHFVAWYEPRHRVLRRCASFFLDRFAALRFSILTPDLTLHWDRNAASFAPGLTREDAAREDVVEAWWHRYYAATFNPARLNQRLLRQHIPSHFRRDLPEARLIATLAREAGARTARMIREQAVGDSTEATNPLG
jgi:DNA polymerase